MAASGPHAEASAATLTGAAALTAATSAESFGLFDMEEEMAEEAMSGEENDESDEEEEEGEGEGEEDEEAAEESEEEEEDEDEDGGLDFRME